MIIRSFLLVFVLCTTLVNQAFGRDTLIMSGHPEYPPVMWLNGDRIDGAGAKVAEHIFEELGIPLVIRYEGPWNRVLTHARAGIIDGVVAAFKTEEREAYMAYSVPLVTDPQVVFVLVGHEFTFEQWDDLIGKAGTTTRGDSFGSEFDRFLAEHLKVERTTTVVQNFRKLEAGHSEYFLYGLYPGLAAAITHGYQDKIVALPTPIVSERLYLTLSKQSPYVDLMPTINQLIEQLQAEGKIEEWINVSLEEYRKANQ